MAEAMTEEDKMKRIATLVAAVALGVPAPLIVPAPAAAESRVGVVDFCKVDVPQNPPAVLGECVSFVNGLINETPGLIPIFCDYVEMFFPGDFYAVYDSQGECVTDRAAQLGL